MTGGSRDVWIFDPVAAAKKGAPGATVTALWQIARKHLDLFMTDSSGIIWSTWWEAGPGWQYWNPIHPEQKSAPGAKVNAAWAPYDSNHLDLIMTSSDGTVFSCYWDINLGWLKWSPISPSQRMNPGAPVTMIWAPYSQSHLDLFGTGGDGSVWGAYWDKTIGWTKWSAIENQQKLYPGTEISAIWNKIKPYNLNLFATASDGTVYNSFWGESTGWHGWVAIHAEQKFKPGAKVTALLAAYDETHIDLFVTDALGIVWSTYRTEGPWNKWTSIYGPRRFAPGTTISAIWAAYSSTHLDLFVTGNDGAAWSTWLDTEKGWRDWSLINPEQKGAIGAEITPVWSVTTATHLDLFMCGSDGLFFFELVGNENWVDCLVSSCWRLPLGAWPPP